MVRNLKIFHFDHKQIFFSIFSHSAEEILQELERAVLRWKIRNLTGSEEVEDAEGNFVDG